MDAYTHELLTKKYNAIGCLSYHLRGFSGLDEFLEEFEGQKVLPGPDEEPYEYRVSRIDAELPFEPGNVMLTQVEGGNDLADLVAPAV